MTSHDEDSVGDLVAPWLRRADAEWSADITEALDVDGALAEVKRRANTTPSAADDVPQPVSVMVGVVASHPLSRSALARILRKAPHIERGVVADSVTQFAAGKQPPGGVVILDPELFNTSDVRGIVAMGHRVLIVSAHMGQSDVLAAVAAGASGYLTKDADSAEILQAVRTIAAGDSYVTPTLASFVLEYQQRSAHQRTELSVRERQVLALIAAGEHDSDIAETMAISVRTVRSYLDRIRDKTGMRRRSELARFAVEQGIAGQEADPAISLDQ